MKKTLPFLLFLLMTQTALADVVMNSKRTMSAGKTSTEVIQIKPDRIRIDSVEGKEKTTIIFRKDLGLMWTIDHARKTYMEMSKDDLKNMSNMLNEAMKEMQKQMESQLGNLPPEQRAQMEKIMKDGMPDLSKAAPKIKSDMKKVASGEKVGNWTTDKYEVTRNGKKDETMWIADWAQLGLKREDFVAFEAIGELFSSMAPGTGQGIAVGVKAEMDKVMSLGLPVKQKYDGESLKMTQEMVSIEKKAIEAGQFEVMAGYKKEEKPEMPTLQP